MQEKARCFSGLQKWARKQCPANVHFSFSEWLGERVGVALRKTRQSHDRPAPSRAPGFCCLAADFLAVDRHVKIAARADDGEHIVNQNGAAIFTWRSTARKS